MTALEQLRAALEAMTPGEWHQVAPPEGNGTLVDDSRHVTVADCDQRDEESEVTPQAVANAAGIVALRNATTALLALAEACAREEQAVCRNQPLVSTVAGGYRAHMISGVEGRCIGGMHIDTCPVALARAARIAALEAIRRLG